MKKLFVLLLAAILILPSCQKQQHPDVPIIPQPQNMKMGNSEFKLYKNTIIAYDKSKILKQQAEYLADLIFKTIGLKVKTKPHNEAQGTSIIALQMIQESDKFGPEGYKLNIAEGKIAISSDSPQGTFYGIQSLYQILLSCKLSIDHDDMLIMVPAVEIFDNPQFQYRGMHLDVCRHMFPVEFIKKYIDILAYYKFNTFHWHLTEDQGWRIEIKKYPKLTEVGSQRKETLVDHYRDKPHKFDGKPYGGYYTQEEVREIVAYAADRQITVIPEIEMPGHSLAALASYPELGCTGGPYEVATKWGVFKDIYCTKEETFDFLENVLLEVMQLFPSEYIHIGGDEAPKARWEECEICQNTIKREGLTDEHELQSYFIQRMEKFLNSHGRKIIGWDEILEGGLAPNATVMSWRGIDGGIAAAELGHDAIMTPGSHCYFDHYQGNRETEPLAIGGHTTLEKVYSYKPVPDSLSDKDAVHILGAQGNVWTEYMKTPEYVEYMILPRMAALSEVLWTGDSNWETFKKRIGDHFIIYDKLGYNYCDHPFEKSTK